jgi:hypothetical protein
MHVVRVRHCAGPLVPTNVPTGTSLWSKYCADLEPPYGIEP